ncbi:MAG: hypothetical protein AAFX39_15795 [Pseudomonadota bacterium]
MAENATRTGDTQPSLLRFLAINAGIGVVVAVILVVGLIASDAHRIGSLIFGSEHPWLPIAMLIGAFVVTFGSITMGCAVMSLPYDDDDKTGGHRERSDSARASQNASLVPVRVPAAGQRR